MDYLHYVADRLFKSKFRLYRDEEDVTSQYIRDQIRYEIASRLFDSGYYCLDLFLITPKRFCNWFNDISSEIVSNARGMRGSEEVDPEDSIYAVQLRENIEEFSNMLVPSFISAVEDSVIYCSEEDLNEDIGSIIAETIERFNVTDLKFLDE